MPRPERPLDPLAGPVQAFAAELRKLRAQAGNPKYLQMARLTGKSRTALSEAAGGDHLPTWETVEAYVTACGADPTLWRLRWEQVEDEVRQRRQPEQRRTVEPQIAAESPVTWVDRPGRRRWSERRLVALIVVLVGLVVLSASAAGALVLARVERGAEPAAGPPAAAMVPSGPRSVEIRSA
ncbi:MAG TPA: helix-turn-helix transcriptional regulator, partial [Pseudonocardiaceae bacterium]